MHLIDFGIARSAGETGLTSTGATIGTWAYMAPERFRTGEADARADIYALACVLYQSLTGQLPFPAKSLEQIAVAHMLEPIPKPSELRAEVPTAMDEVVGTGMAKEPDDRYATTKALVRAARAALTALTTEQSPPTPPAPRPSSAPVETQPPGGLPTPVGKITEDSSTGPSDEHASPSTDSAATRAEEVEAESPTSEELAGRRGCRRRRKPLRRRP